MKLLPILLLSATTALVNPISAKPVTPTITYQK
jgi:hypothetical protein